MVHISLDSDKDSAQNWAKKESFPWLTILPERVKKSGLREYKSTKYVPEYHLVDAEGKTIANGQAQVFAKIAELGK